MDPLSISLAVLPIVASCIAAIAKLRTVLESTKAINGTLLELLTRAERIRLFLDALHSLCAQIRDQVQESFLLDFDKTGCIMTINSLKQLVETVVDDSKKNRYWMKLHWALLKPDAVALIHDLGERQRDINSVIILIAAKSNFRTENEIRDISHHLVEQARIRDSSRSLKLEEEESDDFDTETLVVRDELDGIEPLVPTWPGYVLREGRGDAYLVERDKLSNASYIGKWSLVSSSVDVGREYGEVWANAVRLKDLMQADQISLWTPLHQAAFLCAPVGVVQDLIKRGALRTLRTRWSDPIFEYHDLTAVEIAQQMGFTQLYEALSPVIRHPIPPTTLIRLQDQFHSIIRNDLSNEDWARYLVLPDLNALTELEHPEMWFPLPFGGSEKRGYRYRLDNRELVVWKFSFEIGAPTIFRVSESGISPIDQVIFFNR
ncbi:hypothetical protein Egran_00520 [Elaphomyces granulatus]|uniref:Fungal N-terminal domain-containing protein n=1 Tax=Elaphomyces granulatus TaxID=519963 RepID=A0A232M5Q5_9EURO|nr:hypothetical protein Egran_00520 [Elaphomyces granulatus]